MLTLARIGVLPFFLVAAGAVYFLASRIIGPVGALIAVLLFTTLPPVLGHAGVAATDMAVSAGVVAAMALLLAWMERPTRPRAVALGFMLAAAVLAKFSALVFLPIGLGCTLAIAQRDSRFRPVRGAVRSAVPAIVLPALLVIWAAYGFAVGPVYVPTKLRPCSVGVAECPWQPPGGTAGRLLSARVYPAPALFRGLLALRRETERGRKGFLLGETGRKGWLLFFPVALGLKTPIGLQLLVAAGAVVVIRRRADPGARLGAVPLLAALGIVLVSMPSRLTIGVRHILPVFPLLSIAAAQGVVGLWRAPPRWAGRAVAAACLLAHLVASVAAHPDYIAYFNEAAGGAPERHLVDSDLDWGQDLKRLARVVRRCRLGHIKLAYNGSADPRAVGLDDYAPLAPFTPDTGWIAASAYSLRLGSADRLTMNDFAWLRERTPSARVGTSIFLYYVTDGSPPALDCAR